MRKAFGLPQALMIMLFIASIVVVGMKYSKISVEHYEDTFVKEQAQLYLQNVKEWALLQISGYQRSANNFYTGGTINKNDMYGISDSNLDFKATVKVEKYYLLNSTSDFANCPIALKEEVFTPQSHGMVKLYIVIQSIGSKQKLRLENRSIQRP